MSGDDRVHQPELADAAGERLKLGVADPARVRRVGAEVVDGNLLDAEFGCSVSAQEKSPLSMGATMGTRSVSGGGHEGHGNFASLSQSTTPSRPDIA